MVPSFTEKEKIVKMSGLGFGMNSARQALDRERAAQVIQRFVRGRMARSRVNTFRELPVEFDLSGRPITIVVVLTQIGNVETYLEDTRAFLVNRTLVRLEEYGRIPRNEIMQVRGFLQVLNTVNGASRIENGRTLLQDISLADMEELQEILVESNEDVTPEQVEWSFQIIWPDVVAGKCKRPSWWLVKTAADKKWCRLWNTPDDISCLAYSLVHSMYSRDKKLFDQKRNGLEKAKNLAFDLMKEMKWEVKVSLSGLAEFVKVYKTYTVVVLNETSFMSRPNQKYIGEDYEPKIIAGEHCKSSKLIYLYLHIGVREKHVVSVPEVLLLVKSFKSTNKFKWCFECHYAYNYQNIEHDHDGEDLRKEKIAEEKKCEKCNQTYIVGQHKGCPFSNCKWCSGTYMKRWNGGDEHRCICYVAERSEKNNSWSTERDPDGSLPALLVYDMETMIETVEIGQGQTNLIKEFLMADGKYIRGDDGFVKSTTTKYDAHKTNFVGCMDKHTKEMWLFCPNKDDPEDDPLERFVMHACYKYNKGNAVYAAHNGKGYDTVLLSHYLYKHMVDKTVNVLRNGRKILNMVVGIKHSRYTTSFIDSMCHLPGSLARLAKEMCPGIVAKGYFPHPFNLPINYDYVGPLPPREIFDNMGNMDLKAIKALDTWHAERSLEGDWVYWDEMTKYLKNDLVVQCSVLEVYMDVAKKVSGGMCPLKNITGPGFRHEMSLREVTKNLFDAHPEWEEMQKDNKTGFCAEITEAAMNETWATLKPQEYALCRKALRGGRTEVFNVLMELSQEELDAGIRIRHVDITSSYPFQQIHQRFPVGLPTRIIYDPFYAPCDNNQCIHSDSRTKCAHPERNRNPKDLPYIRKYSHEDQPTAEEILNEEWCGFVCITIQPCKMPIMIAGVYDHEKKKNIYTAEKIIEYCCPSIILLSLLNHGYKLIKVHAFHKYKLSESLFREDTMKLFVLKTLNSSAKPDDFDEYVEKYRQKFGDDFADELLNGGEWGFNPAVKQVMKILLNCGWGKHAQRPRLTRTFIFDEKKKENIKEMNVLLADCELGDKVVTDISNVGPGIRSFSIENRETTATNLHNTYLPAAAFVPAYGQLQLAEEMIRIEKGGDGSQRVLYCDTDSIIYKWYPERFGFYNVPEDEGMLGGWTREDPEEKGGIAGLVAAGPKTYCYKYFDGSFSSVKTKGVRIGHAMSDLVNYEIMKEHVQRKLDGRGAPSISVPQTNFIPKNNRIITTRNVKKIGLVLSEVKGDLKSDGRIVPFGYDTAPEPEIYIHNWPGFDF